MTTFKKYSGTSGIRGLLYETKLISLIFFRAKHDENIEKFQLATNMDGIGTFGDICFRAKIKGIERPVAVFIQARHRENDKAVTFNQNDLVKYFDSYLKIKRSDKEFLFGRKFDAADCFFVIYSNAKDDSNNITYEGSYADCLNDLIGTGDPGSQLQSLYKYENVNSLCKSALKEQLASLAWQMAKFLCDNTDNVLLINDGLFLRYHVILAQEVLDVSEIQPEGYRIASFRQDFFDTKEEFLTLFRETLITKLQERNKIKMKEALLSITFKVPAAFGNKDLTLNGSIEKKERRLHFLTSIFIDLLDKSDPNNIVTIDESIEPGRLQLNGGIAGTIGNLLVTDDNPKLLKFTDNYESLGDHAKRLFIKLKDKVQNLNQYKFDVTLGTMPKLSFAYNAYEENLANDFLDKLLFYSNQADENGVGEILKKEIEDHPYNGAHNTQFSSNAKFLIYHDEIQKWWMMPRESLYLTKYSDIYKNSVDGLSI